MVIVYHKELKFVSKIDIFIKEINGSFVNLAIIKTRLKPIYSIEGYKYLNYLN